MKTYSESIGMGVQIVPESAGSTVAV